MTTRTEVKTTQRQSPDSETRSTNSHLNRKDPIGFVLRNAAMLMVRYEHCRGAEAMNAEGHAVDALSAEAKSLSIPGAILRSYAEFCGDFSAPQYDAAEPIHDFLCEFLNTPDLYKWNQYVISKQHAAAVLNEAAEAREKQYRVN